MLRAEHPEAGSSPLAFDTQFPQPLWRQYFIILVKNLVRTGPLTTRLHIKAVCFKLSKVLSVPCEVAAELRLP